MKAGDTHTAIVVSSRAPLTFPLLEETDCRSYPIAFLENEMISFQVDDMSCGHCVSTITTALKAADKDAKVQIDLATHRVQVESVNADAGALADAIKEAGYTPVPA